MESLKIHGVAHNARAAAINIQPPTGIERNKICAADKRKTQRTKGGALFGELLASRRDESPVNCCSCVINAILSIQCAPSSAANKQSITFILAGGTITHSLDYFVFCNNKCFCKTTDLILIIVRG